jgi:hypothetical protein
MYSEKTCTSTTLSTTLPTSPDLGFKPGRRGGKPVVNPYHDSHKRSFGLLVPPIQNFIARIVRRTIQ